MPEPIAPDPQDEQHLQLLSVFHYVLGGLLALASCLPIIHLVIGAMIFTGALDGTHSGPPAEFGLFFMLVAGCVMTVGWAIALCVLMAGHSLSTRRRYMFCLVTAGLECVFMPLGTILGVFTILVLTRPSVKALFQPAPS